MRTILLAMLVAAAIGLAGTSGVSAVPVNGAAIGDLAKATDPVAQVQWGHWRWGSRGGHWRWAAAGGGGIEIARLAATIGGETVRPAQSGRTVGNGEKPERLFSPRISGSAKSG